MDHTSQAVLDVLAERKRQIEVEGWTAEHDDSHTDGELARAAGIYAIIAGSDATAYRNAIEGYSLNDILRSLIVRYWPGDISWFKPKTRRQDLVKSVALGIAAIEQIDRAEGRS